MPGINSLLNIGQGALFAEQAAIHVTGNNIANVNTAGYSRQAVRFEDRGYIDYVPGQIGLGTRAAEVIRYFDEFIERSYVDKNGAASRWETQYEMLLHVDEYFAAKGARLPRPAFLSKVPVRLQIVNTAERIHLPIQFGPWSYTYSRGS